MCDITRKNFEEKYPQIIDDLQSATFIAIDCEFSGLPIDENTYSLFDTPEARFRKLQNCLENIIIIQLGLSTFKYERTDNTFTVSTYTFYLKPSTALANQKFTSEIQSIEFLCENNFNFNKLFYDGICYLNKSDEAEVLRMIQDGNLINSDKCVEIQKFCSTVAEWNGSAFEGDETQLEVPDKSTTFLYLLHQEIRQKFPLIWTYFEKNSVIRLKKLSDSEKRLLLSNKEEELYLKKILFHSVLSFSRIMKEIEILQKPLIGHNFLIDLILIYKQFYNPSPVSYKQFKKAITNIFPKIYDTKTMSFKLKEFLSRDNTWNSNNLSNLYHYLKEGKGATLVIFTPLINHTVEDYIKKDHFHEAGFDSYCTGFCFLKMAHTFSLWDEKNHSFLLTSMPTSCSWLLGAVENMKNHVNISRGQVNHIVLDGEDPKSFRPDLLYIQAKTNEPLDTSKILQLTAKYASVDIQLLTKYKGLMAVSNQKQVKDILQCFKDHNEYKITKYNFLKHSELGKLILPGTVIATFIIIAVLILKGSRS